MDRKTARLIDRIAIEKFAIPSILLMENAGRGTAEVIAKRFPLGPEVLVGILAGKGNNGGDGFVAARHLSNWGYKVKVILLARKSEITGDARVNLDIISRMDIPIIEMPPEAGFAAFPREISFASVLVDAIFGTGLEGEVRSPFREAIEAMNASGKPIVAIDIPSGLDADTGRILGVACRASVTVTFALPKKGFFLREGPSCVGEIHLVDIGVDAKRILASEGTSSSRRGG